MKHLHTRLGISFVELGALLGTREMLKMGLLKHARSQQMQPGKHIFNMGMSCQLRDCGSVACIGGTMGMLMGMTADEAGDYIRKIRPPKAAGLNELFFPGSKTGCYSSFMIKKYKDITTAQAVMAINNFIKTGAPNWANVLKKKRKKIKALIF